jgi:hypothetical protein
MTLARTNQTYPIFSFSEVRDVRDGNTVFSAVATWTVENFGLEVNGATRPVWGCEVVGNISKWLACSHLSDTCCNPPPTIPPGASQAAVISWSDWKSQFQADPNIVGSDWFKTRATRTLISHRS